MKQPLSPVAPARRNLTRTARRLVAATTAAVLAANLVQVPAALAAVAGYARPPRQPVPAVPVTPVKAGKPAAVKPMRQASAKPAPVWPAAGSALVDVPSGGSAARAGALPVRVAAGKAGVRRLRVAVYDRTATGRAGIQGVLLRVTRADGATDAGTVRVSVDYRSFATAYGADWSSRLRLVNLPACALATPERRECAGSPLGSSNDLTAKTVTADVPVDATGAVLAVTAGASGPAGDYSATSLQPSSTWTAGGNSGSFNWSYPMRVPPALSGPAPKVALSYSSQSVDGRHAASNNQPSWMGEGFEAWPGGFIERRYRPCAKDMDGSANNTEETGDLCWETDNATLSLNGSSGELIYNASEDRWHLRSDDGSRIERKTGASNGDNNGEHWVVTTTDGTQYWFGLNRLPGWASGNPITASTWTAPVFGNDPDEPCHATAFADSDCVQAWRWNLDYVVDLHGNSMSYWYQKETNKYGRNKDPDDDAAYDRGGWLDRIDYGTRRENGVDSALSTPAPLRVDFGVADRCLSSCTTHDEAHWPDTPWDSECTGTSCTDDFAPTFWSTKRLSTVTTQVHSASGYRDVERWTFTHSFPDPGDGTRAGLWLDKISHVGLVGGTTALPDIEFTPVQRDNRVDTTDFAAAMSWMRVARIRNESGGTTNITYSAEDCIAGQPMPTPHTNTRRCYPVIWEPEGYADPVTDWFHKYVVETVYEIDHTGGVPPQGSPRVIYSYDYLDGAAWHYADDDGLIDKDSKTWSDYRGYGRVSVTVGDEGEQTYTETRYFRGMHGDKSTPTGGTRTVTIDGIPDEDWYAGTTRETKTFDGPGGPVVSRQTNDPWASPATATRTINGDTVTARFSRIATTRNHITLDAGRGERVTRTTTSYDSYGMAVMVDDLGEESVAGDEQCIKTDFTPRNESIWLMDKAHRVQTYAVACADTGGSLTEADVIGETRTWYDNTTAFETAPTRGLATKIENMAAWNGGSPTFTTVGQTDYDTHGRVTAKWDAMNAKTTRSYTPATGGPVTSTTLVNPMQHQTVTTFEPAWGLATSIVDPNNKRTDLAYDGLGRLTAVWLPGRDKATETANMMFGYTIRADAASVVSTSKLNAQGGYVTSYALFDGLLRPRQTQVASPSGGRLLTDTFYDSAGRQVKIYAAYHALGDPGETLVTATEGVNVPTQTRTGYDGAGRVTASIFQPYGVERWRTTTYYAGDRTDVTPPAGGTATSTVVDARGRTVELRQYHGAVPTPGTAGSWDATAYQFDRKGRLASVTDPDGNAWTYTYDIRGRQIQVNDPDKGVTTFTHDNANRVKTSTDARGEKLAFLYDPLNRKRAVYDDQVGGTMRAQWVYDTIAKGQLTRSTRFVGTAMYQVRVTGYTDLYQPTGTQIDIPATETGLGGIYNFFNTWNVDGSLASRSMPSTSDLPAETLLYDYNGLGLPTTLNTLYGTSNYSYVVGTDYNALGWVDQYRLYTGSGGRVYQAFTRELETGRLTGVRTDRDSAAPYILADIRYTYDDAGNITTISDVAAAPVDDTQCFDYDYLRRLTHAWTPASGDCAAAPSVTALGGPAAYWHSWTFDAVGNRRTEVVHTTGGDATTTYHYPPAGGAQPHTLTSTSGAKAGSYTYDPTGNTLTRPTEAAGTQTLTWDAEGHLETSTDANGETRYIYDADGNRLIRRDPTGSTLYLPGQEIRYTTSTATTASTRYYAHNGAVIASRTTTGLTWLSSDHQGTAQLAVDAATQSFTLRWQTPYGTLRGGDPAWPNDKGFVGGTRDNTGLVHLGAREYDAAIGRFISVDPIMDLQDPQQNQGYSYANNNPVTLSDPAGLDPGGGWNGCNNECAPGTSKNGDGSGLPLPPANIASADRAIAEIQQRNKQIFLATFTDDFYACRGPLGKNCQRVREAVDIGEMSLEEATIEILCGGTPICIEEYKSGGATLEEFLTILGFLPVVGEPADAINGLIALHNKDWTGAAMSFAAMIPFLGAITGAKRLGGLGRFCSFGPETPVLMGDGTTKPISEIEVGDEVLATDPETGKEGPRRVTHRWVHQDQLVELKIDGVIITTTEDHPYWNATDQQWQRADQLKPGDLLLTADGATVPVTGLLNSATPNNTAYNLTVTNLHTYYVLAGNTPVLVHNSGPFCGTPFGKNTPGDELFHGTDYSLDEMTQFAYGHSGAGNPAMGRPNLGQIEATLRNAGPVQLRNADGSLQNAASFDYNGVRVIINYDQPWKSTTYFPGSLG